MTFLNKYCVPLLRQVPGFENFNSDTEVIHCDKPGTGSVDAPRCFSMKLKIVTDRIGMRPSSVDPELCILHGGATQTGIRRNPSSSYSGLQAVLTKHVDDLKLSGKKESILWILQQIEKEFGELKIEWHTFTNCGLRHTEPNYKRDQTRSERIHFQT